MSLNQTQREATRTELAANLRASGLSSDDVAEALGLSSRALARALEVDPGGDPADVWLVRDYLEQRVRTDGGTPTPYTVLTEQMRGAAQAWFGLRTPPRG